MSSIDTLPARARAAYERCQLWATLREPLSVLPFAALPLFASRHLLFGCGACIALVVLVSVFFWLGGIWRQAVEIGKLVSLPALVVPALFDLLLGHDSFEMAVCAVVCPVTGLVAGGFLGVWSAKQGADRWRALLAGGTVIAAASVVGCGIYGLSAVAGMWVATAVATLGAARFVEI